MKRCLVLFSLLLLLCSVSGCTPVKQQNINDMQWRKQLCSNLNLQSKEDSFSFVFDSVDGIPSSQEYQDAFPYPHIMVKPIFPHFESGKYDLYCPNRGCPSQPEYFQTLVCDSKGVMRPFIPELEGHMPEDIESKPLIGLWGIPGFCSDWYLCPENGTAPFHATFVYEPNTKTNDLGQSLTIHKKEWGGNLLEVCLKGFQPREEVCWSIAEGDKISYRKNKVDSKGCYSSFIWPGAKNMERGTLVVSVDVPPSQLQAKVDWDSKTLFIKRIQGRSSMMIYDVPPPAYSGRELESEN